MNDAGVTTHFVHQSRKEPVVMQNLDSIKHGTTDIPVEEIFYVAGVHAHLRSKPLVTET